VREALDLTFPFQGRWLVQNSPANRVPSHGTTAFASSYAIDFVPVGPNGRSAPVRFSTLVRTEPPQGFPGFGRSVLAPVDGFVVAARDGEVDHHAYRGLPSIGYAVTQRRRAASGWPALAGNHVLVQSRSGPVVAVCHLEQHSVSVREGDRVRAGQPIGRCGNSGNSTEPHVHVQAFTGGPVGEALPVAVTFHGSLPRNGQVVEA
jgi:murein DD-endopeptidase MepM/ murein hydrolase activator NlpD